MSLKYFSHSEMVVKLTILYTCYILGILKMEFYFETNHVKKCLFNDRPFVDVQYHLIVIVHSCTQQERMLSTFIVDAALIKTDLFL